MRLKLPKKSPLLWLYVGGGLLLVVALGFWCYRTTTNPERTFWATIERGLMTQGVTVQTHQTNHGTSVQQTVRYSLGATNLAHSLTTLSQTGTTVKNEVVATPTADYSRYVSIVTDQKKANGQPMNFSKLLGVWAKGQEGSGQFFAQALFGGTLPIGGLGVPLGNLSPTDRAKLFQQIKSDAVYQVAFGSTKKEWVHGRQLYVYNVSVQPVAYVALMKRFAQLTGLHGLDQLDPGTYKGQPPFKLAITVDVRARQVVEIAVPGSTNHQIYSGYDIPVQMRPPANAISATELQQRLSQLQ